MKNILKKFIIVTLFFITISLLNSTYANNDLDKVNVNIVASIDNDNREVLLTNDEYDYGSSFNIDFKGIDTNNTFLYWIVDGVVNLNKAKEEGFVATNDLEAIAVFHKDNEYAITFVDYGGKLIETKYISNTLNNVSEPTNLPNKVNYEYANPKWISIYGSSSLDNVTESSVFRLDYKLTTSIKYEINVSDGNKNDTFNADYNEVVTVKSTFENFTHWEENGKVVSYLKEYKFSALYNRNLIAKTNGKKKSIVTVSNNLNLRNGYDSRLSQVNLNNGDELLEFGFIGVLSDNTKVLHKASLIHVDTLEYLGSFDESKYNYKDIYSYIIVRNNGVIKTIYSDVIIDGFHETFDSSTLTGSYTTKSFEGNEGITWTATDSRNEGDYPIDGSGILFRGKEGDFKPSLTATFPNGINSFSFEYRKAFTGAASRKLKVDVTNKGTTITYTLDEFGSGSGIDNTIYKFNKEDLKLDGEVIIKIYNDANSQVTIDNFIWEEYEDTHLDNYDVYFDLNYDDLPYYETLSVSLNDLIEKPIDPLRDNYIFKGWYLDKSFTNEWNFSNDLITSNITLYAKWELDETYYNILFVYDNDDDDVSLSILSNSYILEPETPIKDGHIFLGWYKDQSFNNKWIFNEDKVTSDLTLYARWIISESEAVVNFVLNNDLEDITVIVPFNSLLEEPLNLTNEGKHFIGWYQDEGFEGLPWDFDNDLVVSNMTLYAHWGNIFNERAMPDGVNRKQLDETSNNASLVSLEPNYFNVSTNKSGTNKVGVYDEIRLYANNILSISIHESFIISKLEFKFGSKENPDNNVRLKIGNDVINLGVYKNETFIYDNLNITNLQVISLGKTIYLDYIDITYYQIGADVLKEDDINRPTFNFGDESLHQIDLHEYFEYPLYFAEDVEDGLIESEVDINKSYVNTDKEGIYYIHYFAIDSDDHRGEGYITVIVKNNNQLENYYDSNILNKSGTDLYNSLKNTLKNTLSLVTYAKAKDVLEISDRDPNKFDNVWLIYNSASIKGKWDSPNYAREHVWAKSAFGGLHSITSDKDGYGISFGESYKGAASDLHNLRAINPSVNSTHSNYEFADSLNSIWEALTVSSRPLNPYTPGNTQMTTNAFFPGDEHKGDVARILLYMVMVWDLTPREDLSLLLNWHLDDPVDNFELIRNEVIYTYQNNRNPFIDYPELFEKVIDYLENGNISIENNDTSLIQNIDDIFVSSLNSQISFIS